MVDRGLGDPEGWFDRPDPLYEHSYVKLDVYLAQGLGGEWQHWPLVSESLFSGRGNVDPKQIRSVLSGQTFPMNLFIQGADIGGGELLCLVHVTCSARAIGSYARARLDFAAAGLGMFVRRRCANRHVRVTLARESPLPRGSVRPMRTTAA